MTELTTQKTGFRLQHLLLILVAGAVLAAAGFGFGYLAIQADQRNTLLGWVEQPNPAGGPAGLSPGSSTVAALRARFGAGALSLDAATGQLQVAYSSLRFGQDRVRMTVLSAISAEQRSALLLEDAADSLSEEALQRAGLEAAAIAELRIDPEQSLDHERVLSSYGRPKLTLALPENSGEPGETAWLYPRRGLMVVFADHRATRFRFRVPELSASI